MTDYPTPPPPGWTPPGGDTPTPPPMPAHSPGAWPPPGAQGVTSFKPGTIALRPLQVSDFFDSTLKTVRRYPGATMGFGFLVSFLVGLIPLVLTLVFVDPRDLNIFGSLQDSDPTISFSTGDMGYMGSLYGGALFTGFTQILIAGMVSTTAASAAVGESLTMGEAWRRTKPFVWRLLGLGLITLALGAVSFAIPLALGYGVYAAANSVGAGVAVGLLALIAASLGLFFLTIRFFTLAGPAIVMEQQGIRAAIRRAGVLSKGQFWRILGIYVLVTLVMSLAASILTVPFSIGSSLLRASGGDATVVASLVINQLGTLVSGAITGPLTGLVACLLYLDQRFRKEHFDVRLINYVEDLREQSM